MGGMMNCYWMLLKWIRIKIIWQMLYIIQCLPVKVASEQLLEWEIFIARYLSFAINKCMLQLRKQKVGMGLPWLQEYYQASLLRRLCLVYDFSPFGWQPGFCSNPQIGVRQSSAWQLFTKKTGDCKDFMTGPFNWYKFADKEMHLKSWGGVPMIQPAQNRFYGIFEICIKCLTT